MKTWEMSVLKVDEPTPWTGKVYRRGLMQRELDALQPHIESRRCIGPVGDDGRVSLRDASFVITGARIDEHGMVLVTIEPLSNGDGKHLTGLLELDFVRLSVSGFGSVNDNVVTDDYKLTGFRIENREPPAVPATGANA